jgi:hypothetical protein
MMNIKSINSKHIWIFTFFYVLINLISFAQSKRLKQNSIEKIITLNKKNDKEKLYKQNEKVLNKHGDYLEEIDYKADGSTVEAKTAYKYDKFYNLIEKSDYAIDKKSGSDSLKLKERRTYEYNGFNELSQEVIFTEDNKVDKKYMYFYNKKGLVVERKVFDSDNKLIGYRSFLYEAF